MKSLTLFAIYIASFIIIFLMMSFIGFIAIGSYIDIIQDGTWLIMYTLLFGWWLALFPTREYYLKNKTEFDRIFS
jgi:hypothetical protein